MKIGVPKYSKDTDTKRAHPSRYAHVFQKEVISLFLRFLGNSLPKVDDSENEEHNH